MQSQRGKPSMVLFTDGTNGVPVGADETAPADIAGTEAHVPRTERGVRIEGGRPVVTEEPHKVEIGKVPAASGGKEDAVTVNGGNQSSIHTILRDPGPGAILP